MFNKFYLGSGIAVLAFYAASAWMGWEFYTPPPKYVPGSVRHSPGGRGFWWFWHSGPGGGK